ncbi:unnamed protein product [Schistosoma curassoni]|uniref:DNA-directed RNA polymerase n=1 Tax=Schistosoma curassoni TaxID=6186 RepID=A0A183JH61_9TREM|nr:unnamed protein product [Schistosoma curassoni]
MPQEQERDVLAQQMYSKINRRGSGTKKANLSQNSLYMVIRGSQQETLDPDLVLFGTRQQGVPVILSKLMLSDGFNLMSPSFTIRCYHWAMRDATELL